MCMCMYTCMYMYMYMYVIALYSMYIYNGVMYLCVCSFPDPEERGGGEGGEREH